MNRIRRSSFISSVLVLASGTAIAQALPVLFIPLISRLFAPEDFGVLGIFTAFIGFAATFVALSFPLAIVSNVTRRTSAQLTVLALAVTVPMATVASVLLLLLRGKSILGFASLPLISALWAWLVLTSVGVFLAFRYWQVREEQFGRISRATIGQSLGRVTTQVATGLLAVGGGGLLFAEVVARLMGVSTLLRASWRDVTSLASGTTFRSYLGIAKEYRKFPLLSTPSSMMDSLSAALPIPLLTAAYSLSLAGQFSMAYQALALPVAVVSAAVADVFHGHLVRVSAESMDQARSLFLRVSFILFCAGILPSLLIFFWGPDLFRLILGSRWELAGELAAAIIPWLLAAFVVGPVSRVVFVFRGQEVKFIYDILALLSVIGAIRFGKSTGMSIESTAQLLAVTQVVVYGVYFLLLWRILNTHVPSHQAADGAFLIADEGE